VDAFPLLMAVILLGMAVHRVFFPADWRRRIAESKLLTDEEIESYRRFSIPVLLVAAVWFLSLLWR